MNTVREWLTHIGHAQYAELFEQNEIGLDVLRDLSEKDLQDLGLPLGTRKRLMKAIAGLDLPEPPPPASSPKASPHAQRRQLTVLFCDLVDSTVLSARLDPEVLREVVREYQAACSMAITRFEGHIAQYLGDGLLVYFGHPQAHEDDAHRAVRAGLGILEAIKALNLRLSASHCVQVSVRLGVHTGLVVLGEVGAGERRENLALGETPNVAARLQSLATPDTLVVSAATYRLIEGWFEVTALGEHALKGLGAPLRVYQVLSSSAARHSLETRASLSVLVGRDQEVSLLADRWERAVEGSGQVVLLAGEAGIGKSRMVRALDEALRGTPHHRAELRCAPLYTHTPLYPFMERLPSRFGWEAGDSTQTELAKLEATLVRFGLPLEESFPLLANLLSRPAPERYPLPLMSPQRQRRRTLETLAALLSGMAADQPVLLVVEDLHWADPTTLELIGQNIEQAPTTRMLIVLTARPGFQSPWGNRSYLTPLLLNRLTLRQTEHFIMQLTRGKALPQEVLRQIVDKTDGVPLFVEEITKYVLESDLLHDKGDHYELSGPLPPLAIPATLQDSLMARLDRLPAGREVVQLAATLGRNFSFRLISALSGKDEAGLTQELDQLVSAELLFQKGFGAQANYVFKHALIQDAAYQSQLKSTRQQIHQRVAGTLVQRFPEEAQARPEYVAHHYTEAGLMREAADYWQRAGRMSAQRSAFPEAIAHYRRGLDSIAGLADATERDRREIELQLALGNAIVPLRGYTAPEAAHAFLRASELADKTSDSARQVEALWGLGLGYWVGQELGKGRAVAERCFAIANNAGDEELLLAAHHLMGCTAMAMGRCVEARQHLEALLALYGDEYRIALTLRYSTDLKANALHFLAVTLWFLGYPQAALQRCKELAEFWPDTPFLYNRIWRSVGLAQVLAWLREPFGGEAQIDADIRLCEEQDFFFMRVVISILRGAMRAQGGDAEQGIRDLEEGIAVYRALNAGFSLPVFLALLAAAYLSVKRTREGLAAVAEGLAAAKNNGEHRADAELHRLRGELLLIAESSGHAQAENEFLLAIEIARSQEAKSLELRAAMSLARLWQTRGKPADAYDLLAPVYNWFTEGFDTKDLKEAKALIDELGR